MKKNSILIFSIILVTFLISCNSLPKNSRTFIETEGRPLELEKHSPDEYVNGVFPDEIFIKTQLQTFSFNYEYQIYDGKIYYKQRGTDRFEWKIFKNTGLPYSEKEKFDPVEEVV